MILYDPINCTSHPLRFEGYTLLFAIILGVIWCPILYNIRHLGIPPKILNVTNGLLFIYSTVSFVLTLYETFNLEHPWLGLLGMTRECYTKFGNLSYLLYAFGLSKVAELFEGWMKAASGKKLSFLYVFHHQVTFAYGILLSYTCSGLSLPTSLMNMFIHSIMYFYFVLTGFGYKPFFGKFVTQLQIVQMIVGFLIHAFHVVFIAEQNPFWIERTTAYIGMSIYASYILLFLHFYLQRWTTKPHKN